MPSRFFRLVRWLLAASQLLLLAAPPGVAARPWSVPHCQCGMERGHCCCMLSRAKAAAGHCGMKAGAQCSLRSPEPLESRTSPLGPDFPDRLGVFRRGGPGLDATPRGTVASLTVLAPEPFPAPPDLPPPRNSFRIG